MLLTTRPDPSIIRDSALFRSECGFAFKLTLLNEEDFSFSYYSYVSLFLLPGL